MGFTEGTTNSNRTLRVRLVVLGFGFATVLATISLLVVVLGVGKWLVREDPLQPAAAIVVLSGNMPVRALEAAELYRQGYAKEVWLTHPGAHADALKLLGFSYPSEDDFNIRVLRRQGVPAKAIHVLDSSILNTDEELDVISATLKERGGERVIIVTNRAHTRRVHMLWTKYFATRGSAIVHGVSDDQFDAAEWWHTSGDLKQVAHEVMGIADLWTGMPVKARPSGPDTVLAEGDDSGQRSGSTD